MEAIERGQEKYNLLAGILYAPSLGFLAGVLCASLVGIPLWVPCLLGGVGLVAALFALRAPFARPALLVALFLAANVFGILRVNLLTDPEAPFLPYDGRTVLITGKVAGDPERNSSGVTVLLSTKTINGSEVRGLLSVQLPVGSSVAYGERLSLRGVLALPQPFVTGTGTTFDYPTYLRAKGIGATMRADAPTIVSPAGFSVLGSLYALKHAFMRALERTVPEPEASFLEGMLLGNRDALSGTLHDAFVTAGLVHIVVLSGYNLTLVSDVFSRVTALFLPRLLSIIASGASVVLFALMAGLDATVVRAGTMALIVLLARALRRPSVILRSLTLACVLMVAWHPLVMVADPSFVLSFLATFGLVTLSGPAARLLSFVPDKFSMREIAASTIAVQAFVSPVLIYYTGTFSLVSLPANLLALPLVPYAMLSGFIAACVGLIGPTLALPFTFGAWVLLGGIIRIATTAASVPFASLDVSLFQTPYLLWTYALLGPCAVLFLAQHERQGAAKQKTATL